MAQKEQLPASAKPKETTPLLVNDLENAYGTTTTTTTASAERKSPQTLWEWTKAEVACYSKKLSEEWDRINRYGPNHQSPRWKEARSSRCQV
ncbi:unnamed protein product [Calypogeia fissa]